jgi:uncharacterized zinc-type alcohol dehydrogenase-like protein
VGRAHTPAESAPSCSLISAAAYLFPQALPLPSFPLLTNRRSLSGSMIGGIRETQEMLDFCAEHGLGADVEVVTAEQINDTY